MRQVSIVYAHEDCRIVVVRYDGYAWSRRDGIEPCEVLGVGSDGAELSLDHPTNPWPGQHGRVGLQPGAPGGEWPRVPVSVEG